MGTLTLNLDEVVKGFPLNHFEAHLKLTEESEIQSASFGKIGAQAVPKILSESQIWCRSSIQNILGIIFYFFFSP